MSQRLRVTGRAVHFSAGISQFTLFSMTGHTGSDGFIRIGGCHEVVAEELIEDGNCLKHNISGQSSAPFLLLFGF